MDENLVIVAFADDARAYEALSDLKRLDASAQVAIREAAVVQRSDTGELSVRDETDPDEFVGTATGGFIGLLVGILGGPIGVLFGGAIGLLAGSLYDIDDTEETDSVLEHIAREIPKGATALIAAVGENGPDALDGAMHGLGGGVTRYTRDEVEAELAAAEQAARDARRQAREEMLRARRESVRDEVRAKLDEMGEKLRAARQRLVHH